MIYRPMTQAPWWTSLMGAGEATDGAPKHQKPNRGETQNGKTCGNETVENEKLNRSKTQSGKANGKRPGKIETEALSEIKPGGKGVSYSKYIINTTPHDLSALKIVPFEGKPGPEKPP